MDGSACTTPWEEESVTTFGIIRPLGGTTLPRKNVIFYHVIFHEFFYDKKQSSP